MDFRPGIKRRLSTNENYRPQTLLRVGIKCYEEFKNALSLKLQHLANFKKLLAILVMFKKHHNHISDFFPFQL